MKMKDSVKLKLDQLDNKDLREVVILIDTIRARRKSRKKPVPLVNAPYELVLKHLGSSGLSSTDILQGRQERI